MAQGFDFKSLPKCDAYARSSGKPCQRPAMANGKCYHHGGAMVTKHGRYTKQAKQKRREERQAIRVLRESQKAMEKSING